MTFLCRQNMFMLYNCFSQNHQIIVHRWISGRGKSLFFHSPASHCTTSSTFLYCYHLLPYTHMSHLRPRCQGFENYFRRWKHKGGWMSAGKTQTVCGGYWLLLLHQSCGNNTTPHIGSLTYLYYSFLIRSQFLSWSCSKGTCLTSQWTWA